jgi:hypothetical protein
MRKLLNYKRVEVISPLIKRKEKTYDALSTFPNSDH